MSSEHFTTLGQREIWGGSQPFGLSRADRRQHVYLIGKSGTGKTTLLRNLIVQDIEAGHGLAVIDPHGDLAEELLDLIPPWRTDHVVYFNPGDFDHPFGFNLLADVPQDARHAVAAGIVGAFKAIWRDSWGPRLEYFLYAAVASLLECQNVTLLGIPRLLVDEEYRRWVVKQLRDPMLLSFWRDEFASYDDRFRNEAISPILNKVSRLLVVPAIRNVLGQVQNRLDARFIMDDGRIFIANLCKGRVGEDTANLLGAILVTQFQLAAMSRADVPENERRDFTLVADEFPSYTTESFASILSESRKYRLSLVIANQFTEQVPDGLRSAIFGNVGSIISFRSSEADAAILSREFGIAYPPTAFTDLANYEVLVRQVSESTIYPPFRGITDPPTEMSYRRRDNLIGRSRCRFTTPRSVVQDKISRWLRISPRKAN